MEEAKIISEKNFFGTVESCRIDEEDKAASLCFICEKIVDEREKKEVPMKFDKIPMAVIILPNQIKVFSDLLALRQGDKLQLRIRRINGYVEYEVKNLTLQTKYQDAAVYVGMNANGWLSAEPHSTEEEVNF